MYIYIYNYKNKIIVKKCRENILWNFKKYNADAFLNIKLLFKSFYGVIHR